MPDTVTDITSTGMAQTITPPANARAESANTLSRRHETKAAKTTAIVKQHAETWVEIVRCVALAVFVAVPLLGVFVQPLAGRVTWTVAVAALPLFIVLAGFHRWRRICPLALFARLPGILGRSGNAVMPAWLEHKYHLIPLAFFVFGLWMRLVATNGDGQAIALFFVSIALFAFLSGVVYTGKTWCNYICPVSFIEKIYTEPHGLRETPNSQCVKCTACKKNCPDINAENGYWKEVELPAKKLAYLSFPGLVLGFYTYYYLQSGTWEYYFGGIWTNEPGIWRTAFLPGKDAVTAGFFFWPEIPRAAASLGTLLAFALASYVLFTALEPLLTAFLRRRNAADPVHERHVLLSIAAFSAFVTFYSFAGVPTLRLFHPAPHFVLIVVVLTASIYLFRRLTRTQRAFAEETLARNIVKRWEWQEPVPSNLREAFLIHTIHSKETQKSTERSLEIYKEAVREALADGLVTRGEIHRLEALRDQLQIKQADHDKIMAALDEEERALLSDPSKQISTEKRLQLENYGRALEKYLESAFAPGAQVDDVLVASLRQEYRVSPDEHKAVLEDVLSGARGIGARLSETVGSIERASHTIVALEREPSPGHDFLREILERRRWRAVELLARSLVVSKDIRDELKDGLCSNDPRRRESIIEKLRGHVSPVLAERLLLSQQTISTHEASLKTLAEKLAERMRSSDAYTRAVALYCSGTLGSTQTNGFNHLDNDEHHVVRETAIYVKSKFMSGLNIDLKSISLSAVEKMIALRSTPLFARLEPESLDRLARACSEKSYSPGEALCRDGENGDEVFILVEGDVEVVKGEGASRKVLATEKAGGFIGELAVLDPGPRSATVLAGPRGARALCLNGAAFRNALHHDADIAAEVMRTLAQRLKQKNG